MADDKKTVILNGTKVWLSCLAFLVVHFGTAIWWASGITKDVSYIKRDVTELRTDVKYLKREQIASNAEDKHEKVA